MRIGIDARNLVPKLSGIGRYVTEMTRNLVGLGHEVNLYLPAPPFDPESLCAGTRVDISNFPGPFARIVWGNSYLPLKAKSDRVDVLWGPAHRLPLVGSRSLPVVLTVHDLVWRHASSTMRRRGLYAERAFMGPSIARARRIAAISYATKSDISDFYPWAESKIEVVYPGCTTFDTKETFQGSECLCIDRPYILFVGTLEPRKNLLNLLSAYSKLPLLLRERLLLVIAGGQGWGLKNLNSQIERLGISSTVRLPGFTTERQLGMLYKNARFLAMPSLYEGFGLPIVEANSFGIPALTSNVSSMPEVGGNAALLVEPDNVTSIREGLERLATDNELLAQLSSHASENAARFNWQSSAKKLVNVFERAIG